MANKRIDFFEMESTWKKFWEKENIYRADLSKKKIYSVDTPPPTVSGEMHMGHAFSYSQQDFIVRFRRMLAVSKGGSVFYPFGTDDNGLPTERLVERINKVKSKNMSRSEFINLCLKTLKKITPDFIQTWKDLGVSCDYNLIYSTIDDSTRKISQKYFLDLFNKGEAYKKSFPTLWCPECQTSIAQAELDDKTSGSLFSTLKFKVDQADLLIATTRPELIGACVAVFVNPEDKRYKKFVGKEASVPLFNHKVPILEDKSADPEKGTGVLMICSYGDRFDVDAINRHNLESKEILNPDGTLKIKPYEGLRIKQARNKILEDLNANGLVSKQEDISHVVNVHDKCGTSIEFISTEQWFIKLLDKKKKLIQQGKKVKWYPEYMFKRYENWVNGLEWDWSISRDRHFGIPIPIWECKLCNKIIVPSDDELPVDPLQLKKKCDKCGNEATPEDKVLDTWATSSLTPQIADSLINNKVGLPFSLRPQAHDIIRTWAFYTIMRGFLHENKIPWEEIVISGNVSLGGEKMSKSKGNVIDPKKVMKEYGSDALRFWAAGSKLGSDLDYQEKDLVTGKKFVNKLLNASKFVFMNLENLDWKKPKKLEKIDELFLEKLNVLVMNCTESFMKYEYSRVKSEIEQFFWKDFTDNYIEIVKKRIYQGDGNKRFSAAYTLYNGLFILLKLIAPIMPFVTEEIYQTYFRKYQNEDSIHILSWPEREKINKSDKNYWESFLDLITKIRSEKSNSKKAMNSECIITLEKADYNLLEGGLLDDLKDVVNADEIKIGKFKVEFK